MPRLAKPLLRVGSASAVCLGALFAGVGFFVRQPSMRVLGSTTSAKADAARLEADVHFLVDSAGGRNPANADKLDAAADYIATELRACSDRFAEQTYPIGRVECRNLIARFGPENGSRLVVGAHYDVFGDLPGADDNASGVAGLLELARLLVDHPPAVPVELVAFSTEEPPHFGSEDMGSAVHARSLRENGTDLLGMICLEMIGYYCERQPSPHWLIGSLYPKKGDFITVVGRRNDRALVGHVKAAMKGAGGVRVCSFTGPPILGADLSDHRNYWINGYSAVMITDTAYVRNPHYHSETDLPDTLDYDRMATVVDGVLNAILHFE